MAEALGGYFILAGVIAFIGMVLLCISVSEYRSAKRPNNEYDRTVRNNMRPWIRRWLYLTLLSPVWPVTILLIIGSFIVAAFKITLEDSE